MEVLIKDVVVSMPRSKKDAYIEAKVKKYIKLGKKSASWDDPILKQIQFTDTLSRVSYRNDSCNHGKCLTLMYSV